MDPAAIAAAVQHCPIPLDSPLQVGAAYSLKHVVLFSYRVGMKMPNLRTLFSYRVGTKT